jgi:tetratricopeptide (TPR) repeat protein
MRRSSSWSRFLSYVAFCERSGSSARIGNAPEKKTNAARDVLDPVAWILSRRAVAIGIILMYAMPALSADLNAQAQALQTSGDWNGLKKLATDWTRTEPKSAAPWLYLGLADDQLGQPNDAINAYEQGLALDPKLATGWMYLAADYHKIGQPQKVAEVIKKLEAINPSIAMMVGSQYPADLQTKQPARNGYAPSGLPQKAAAALGRAQKWHSDAELMIIEVTDYANNGQFQIKYSFFSPSDGTGLVVVGNNSLPVGAANWGAAPIPAQFLDLPVAVQQARVHGLKGAFNNAVLRVGDHGLSWTITPTKEISTVEDPFMRRGAFTIPATVK